MLRPTLLLDKTKDDNNNNKDTKDNDDNHVNQDAEDNYAGDDNDKHKTTISISSCKTHSYCLR
jgi:hypothetical protein